MTLWKFQRLGVNSLETPQRKWASSRLEGRTSWIFSSCGRCSRRTTGTSGTRSGGLRKGQSPFEVLGGLSAFLSHRYRGLRPCVECCRNLRILSSADMDLGVLLESPQGSQSSFRVGACTCAFLPSCSCSVPLPFAWIKGFVAFPLGFPKRLSHEAFPPDFPTGLSHVPPWCELILGLKVEAVQRKQVSLEWTETSGGLWEWWHDPGVPLAFPVESASS